jgi:hypothetical protein
MRKQRLKLTLLGIVTILASAGIVWWLVSTRGQSTFFVSDLPLHTPADWGTLTGTPELMSFPDQRLLALRVPSNDVNQEFGSQSEESHREWRYYLYDTSSEKLRPADESVWSRDGGAIGLTHRRGDGQLRYPPGFVAGTITSERFGLANNNPVADQYIHLTFSPQLTLCSVISAHRVGGMSIPFLGAENGSTGRHFHQMLDLDSRDWIGEPVGLPFTSRRADFEPVHLYTCWSADERWVVYVHDDGVVFVPVEDRQQVSTSKEP